MEKKFFNDFDMRTFFKNTPIKWAMSSPVITIDQNQNFSSVEETFVAHSIRHLPVVDKGKRLVGLITKRDLYRTVSPRKAIDGQISYSNGKIVDGDDIYYFKDILDSFILKNVMIKHIYTLKAENCLLEAVDIIVKEKIGCVPIVNNENIVKGIVTRYDILRVVRDMAKG